MKKHNVAVSALAAVLFMSLSAHAQKRKPTTPQTPAGPVVSQSAQEIKAGVETTASQLKKVSRFVFLLGGIAQGIEDIDQQAKAGKASKPVIDQNEQFKQSVMLSIRNLGAGLAALEVEFRTKGGLRPFAPKIEGVTAKTGAAEDLAAAGKFKESGKQLLVLIDQLADVLAALP